MNNPFLWEDKKYSHYGTFYDRLPSTHREMKKYRNNGKGYRYPSQQNRKIIEGRRDKREWTESEST